MVGAAVIVGTVLGRELTTNLDGDKIVYMLTVQGTDPDDIQTVQLAQHGGIDYSPPDGSRVTVFENGDAWLLALAVDDGIAPEMKPGEREIYSTNNNATKMARCKFCNDGVIEFNGTTDHAVRFSKLKVAFDQLKDDFDALVVLYNAHIHVTTATVGGGATPGVIATTTSQGSESTADIDPAKIDEIKVS